MLDAKLREVTYRLRLAYDEPHMIKSEYVSGDFRDLSAVWRFTENGNGTTTSTSSSTSTPAGSSPARSAASSATSS